MSASLELDVAVQTAAASVYGRERELDELGNLLDGVTERGGALVIRGEAGIGKSALLSEAGSRARDGGMQVLTTAGAQTEAHLPFAGLHHLLRPALGELDRLPARQRAAISTAFGIADEAAPDIFLISLAALDMLAEIAARAPLLLVVEDAQWLDASTCAVLAFVARRLELEPIVLLFAVREGIDGRFEEGGLPELRLEPLDQTAAGELPRRARSGPSA